MVLKVHNMLSLRLSAVLSIQESVYPGRAVATEVTYLWCGHDRAED